MEKRDALAGQPIHSLASNFHAFISRKQKAIYQGLKGVGNESCQHAEMTMNEYIDEFWKATSRLEPSQLEGNVAKEQKKSQSMGKRKLIGNQRKAGMPKKSPIKRHTIEHDQMKICSEICDQLEKETAGRRTPLQ
jgi:hypothetical protein